MGVSEFEPIEEQEPVRKVAWIGSKEEEERFKEKEETQEQTDNEVVERENQEKEGEN